MAYDSTVLNRNKTNLAALLLGIGFIAFSPSIRAAEPVPAQDALQAVKQYQIKPQALSSALLEFSKTADIKLIYDAALTRGLDSPGLAWQYSSQDALRRLLEKTGIEYSISPSGFIKLQAASMPNSQADTQQPGDTRIKPADPVTLPKVNVVGSAVYDVKDPYNQDYVLPNATSGTKTDTPIMETPLNVQVVSKQVLKDQQVIRLDEALKNVSGVTTGSFAYGAGNPGAPSQQITLRGFASETFFRDGFRLQQGSASREMANVEAVEVLKGPAAILYGMVEPGGMVNVITKKPLATPYYALNQQFGSYNLYRTTLDATGPLTKDDTLMYRMNMSYENSGSFRDLVFNDNVFLAPVLKWNVSPKTQATLEMEYQHKNFVADTGFVPLNYEWPYTGLGTIINTPVNRNFGEYSPRIQDTIFTGLNWWHQFNDDWSIKHRVSVNKVKSNTPLSAYPIQNFSDPNLVTFSQSFTPNVTVAPGQNIYSFTDFNLLSQNDTYSTNIDLTGHFATLGLKHTLLFGGDYYRLDAVSSGVQDRAAYNNWNNGGPPISYVNLNNPVYPGTNFPGVYDPTSWSKTTSNTDQYGLYIQDQIKLPYDVHVMGGIRYQYIHQKSVTQDYTGLVTPGLAQTQDAVTPRVGILWQARDWLSTNANYTESFGANQGLMWPNSQVVPPTSASQYEGGIKTEFFEGRLRATLAYYDLNKTNVAASDPDGTHICGGIPGGCTLAIGEVHSHGPEVDIQGQILKGWNVIATYTNTSINVTKTDTQNSFFLVLIASAVDIGGFRVILQAYSAPMNFRRTRSKVLRLAVGLICKTVNWLAVQLRCFPYPVLPLSIY